MDMQDKEFDQLFSSKFDNFEVEPSPMVWDNITSELDGKKGIHAILPYLSIAATILVVLTAGVLLLQEGGKPTIDKTPTKLVANRMEPAVTSAKATIETVEASKPAEKIALNSNHHHNNIAPVADRVTPANNKPDNTVKLNEPTNIDNQPLLAAAKEPASTEIKATVPDNDIQLAPKTLITATPTAVGRPEVMASAEKQEEAPVKRRGIHSLGGLINVLVAKIDKREDKFIEFGDAGDDDDTQSKVTGVNLGILKIKQQK